MLRRHCRMQRSHVEGSQEVVRSITFSSNVVRGAVERTILGPMTRIPAPRLSPKAHLISHVVMWGMSMAKVPGGEPTGTSLLMCANGSLPV